MQRIVELRADASLAGGGDTSAAAAAEVEDAANKVVETEHIIMCGR
jgi:hypothetical protein